MPGPDDPDRPAGRPIGGERSSGGRLRLRPVGTAPLHLERVVVSHGWFQTPPFAWDPASGLLRRRERLGGGVVDLEISRAGAGVWVTPSRTLGGGERRQIGRRVRRMLQLDVDLADFHEGARRVDASLAADLASIGAGRLLAGSSLWEDVAKAICGTNVAWRQAVSMIEKLADLDPDGAFPEPDRLLEAGEATLRASARVGYRAPYLIGAARMAAEGGITDLEAELASLPPADVVRALSAIPGVGPTTARFVAYLAGRFDVGPLIDSATIPAAAERWFDGRRPSNAEIAARVEPAGEWAALTLYWATMRRWQMSLHPPTAG